MPETETPSQRSTQTISLIESKPLTPASWELLVNKVRGQNDPLSIRSLEIIINGLKELETKGEQAVQRGDPAPRLSSLAQSLFVRLAKAYNSPTLLKEVGLIYLRDLNMPDIALQHFERSLRLGGPEKELRPLTEAAAVSVQRALALQSGAGQAHSGITTAQHTKAIAPSIIRKTGKLLLPSRFTQTASTKLTDLPAETDSQVLELMPATTDECLAQAKTALAEKKMKRATALLNHANKSPASSAVMWQAWTDLGQAYYEIAQHAQVEAAFLQALKYGPMEMASHFNVALGQHLNNKYDLALASYLQANQLEPKHPKVWCNLGVLYFQMDQYPQAESALRYATMANMEYARAWDNLAAALGAQDKLDEALEACDRAVALRPDYPEAHFKMGVVYFSRNDFARAADEFKKAALLPTLAAYCDCFQSMVHSRLEQTDAAEAAAKRATKTDPKCDLLWMAWNDLGLALYGAGKYPQAAVAYGEATMIKPDEPEAWFNLGVSYHQTGDLKSARSSYQQAVDLRESMAGAWHNLGIVCVQNDDHQAAVQAFRQEVHWAPTNVRAWYDLGVTMEKLGRLEEARFAFNKVDSLTPAPTPSVEEPAPPATPAPSPVSDVKAPEDVTPAKARITDPNALTSKL